LRRHFLGHRSCNNHQIGLAGRWPEDFTAKPRNVIARRCRCDHFNGATRETELQRPERVLASPIVKFLHRGHPDPLALQLAAKPFVDLLAHSSFITPFP
jgi:hypothetical protein